MESDEVRTAYGQAPNTLGRRKGIARKRAPTNFAWTHGEVAGARSRAMLFNQQPTTNNPPIARPARLP